MTYRYNVILEDSIALYVNQVDLQYGYAPYGIVLGMAKMEQDRRV